MNETTTQDAGDVVPLPATRPPVDTLPTPSQRYLPGYSPYMPNYDYDWHRILTPPPSNDARSGLPDSLQPGYRPQMPYQLAGAPVASSDQPATPDQRNYTVTGTGPGTWWRSQPPGGQWRDRPDVQPPQPSVALNRPPAFQQGHQPGPWPAAYPNSPRFDPAQAPPLPGETPQETTDLNKFMAHETGNRGNIINDWAARDPSRYYQGQTCQGYWQITNSTWRDGAQRAGVDLRQYPTAMTAPYPVQRAVALALYRSYGGRPWAVPPGAGERGDRFALRPQQPPPAEPRDYRSWGQDVRDDASLTSAPPRDFGPGPSGQGGLGQPPQESGWVRVLNGVGPLLVGIASLALRLPLSTAITAAGAMARAQDNGQREAYERARTRMQDQLKEANAQQTLESREASDAFVEYGNNNPAGLQQTLAQIALRYNDPIMYRMAEQGDLNGIHQLQQRRDLYNQDLTRANKAADEEQKRRDIQSDVAARDRQWDQEHPNATPEERAIAHAQHFGEAQRDVGGRVAATPSETQGPILNVIDKTTGKPTGQQVVRNREGTGYRDANTGQPVTLKSNEEVQEIPRQQQPKLAPPANPYVQPGQEQTDQQAQPDQDQPDQSQSDQAQPDQGQPDQAQPDQTSPDQGAAPQAPAGPVQTAAAAPPAQAAAPAPAALYQVAQAGSGVQPPPSTAQPAQDEQAQGPAMRHLTPAGQALAREYLQGNEGALRDVPTNQREPIVAGATEMQRRIDDVLKQARAGKIKPDDIVNRVRGIDENLGDLLDNTLKNKRGIPAGGGFGASMSPFWNRIINLATAADPNWNPQQYPALQAVRNSYGPQQRMGQTLLRSFRLAQLSRALWEDAATLPSGPVPANELQRWFESGVAGDPKYTKFASDWHNFAVESQAVVNGGQPTVTLSRMMLDTLQRGATPAMVRQAIQADLTASLGAIDAAVVGWRQSFPDERNPGTYDQSGYSGLYQLHTGNVATGELGGALPQVGAVEGGKTYLGGDPADRRNWR